MEVQTWSHDLWKYLSRRSDFRLENRKQSLGVKSGLVQFLEAAVQNFSIFSRNGVDKSIIMEEPHTLSASFPRRFSFMVSRNLCKKNLINTIYCSISRIKIDKQDSLAVTKTVAIILYITDAFTAYPEFTVAYDVDKSLHHYTAYSFFISFCDFFSVSKNLSMRGTHCSTFLKFCLTLEIWKLLLLNCSCDFHHFYTLQLGKRFSYLYLFL